jgi:hypothetical protein
MSRTTWLQDRKMQKFRDVLSRWERKELSAMEAGEVWGARSGSFGAIDSAMKRAGSNAWSISGWAGPRRNGCRWTRSPGCWSSTGLITRAGR